MKFEAKQNASLWNSDLPWSDYEVYVYGSLQRLLPGSRVQKNVKIKGRLSGRSRQVDILVEQRFESIAVPIAVDCKCFKRRVSVKDVEMFIGMLEDLGIRKGAIITTKGYSKSAEKRAQFGARRIDLRIISPERLSDFQHMGDAILWREPVAAILSPPPGWVADNEDNRPNRMQVMMYPLGHTRNSALRRGAILYANIFLKRDTVGDIESVALHHETETKERYPDARFQRLESPLLYPIDKAQPAKTILRRGDISPTYDGPEYTLYIDHPKAVLTLVLLCHEGEDAQFLPLLIRVGETALLRDMTDQRLERLQTVDGRIAVFWNRARYVEVFKRPDPKTSWMTTERFIEITEPRRVYHAQNLNDQSNIESCEFHSVQIPVRPEWRVEFPGEGWGVRLWDAGANYPRPQVALIHVDGSVDLVENPDRLFFFTSTRSPFPPDEWPEVPGVDSQVDLGLG